VLSPWAGGNRSLRTGEPLAPAPPGFGAYCIFGDALPSKVGAQHSELNL